MAVDDDDLLFYIPYTLLKQYRDSGRAIPAMQLCITKTYLYNFDPLNPTFI